MKPLISVSAMPTYDMATIPLTRVGEEIVRKISTPSSFDTQTNLPVCPIDSLPTEILEAIFIECAIDHHTTVGGLLIPSRAPSWVRVSYVSRRWRNIALDCAALWSYIFITSPRWTEEQLARSRQAPLKIYVDLTTQREQRLCLLKKVTSHLDRVQELRLNLTDCDYESLSILSSRAPRLENLEIWGEFSPQCTSLFDGDTPALRTLELRGCSVAWYSLKLAGLTMLSLTNIPASFHQDMTEFLATLSYMQGLTYLHLQDALASAATFLSTSPSHARQKITLPYLSRLLIAAPLSTVVALLLCVDVPSKTKVNLRCRTEYKSSWLDNYGPLYSLLARRLSILEDQALESPINRHLVVGYTVWGEAKLAFSSSKYPCDDLFLSNDMEWNNDVFLQVMLSFSDFRTTNDKDWVLSHFCCLIPFPNVRSLHVLNPPSSPAFWTHVLGYLQGLRSIKFSCGRTKDLTFLTPCDCTENGGEYANQCRTRKFAPELEEVELDQMEFTGFLEYTLQSLWDALFAHTKHRGRFTLTQCGKHNLDGRLRMFDMAGWWEDGRLHVISRDGSDSH